MPTIAEHLSLYMPWPDTVNDEVPDTVATLNTTTWSHYFLRNRVVGISVFMMCSSYRNCDLSRQWNASELYNKCNYFLALSSAKLLLY